MGSEWKESLCLGVLKGRWTFCTLGASHFTYSSQNKKKASVEMDHLYISGGHSATGGRGAFINHHLNASLLSVTQMNTMLSETHTKDDWVQIFHAWT